MIFNRNIEIHTKEELDFVDMTSQIRTAVADSELKHGIANVFAIGSTCAIITIENEEGLIDDFKEMLKNIIPNTIEYYHNKKWNDSNGHSHLRASLVGQNITIPFIDGELLLGTWQQIILIELDIRPRQRIISIMVMGD